MSKRFLEVRGDALIIARDHRQYQKMMIGLKREMDASNAPTWADQGVAECDLGKMAGGNENLVLCTFIEQNKDAACTTYDDVGRGFTFDVCVICRFGFIACTKDGRPFTTEEEKHLLELGRRHIEAAAKDIGVLYLRLYSPDDANDKGRLPLWQPHSAAETCEMTRKEADERRAEAAAAREAIWNLVNGLD